jgi:putative transposase
MARHPRLIVPGVAVHIVQRGVDRQACFREEADQFVYLSLLRAVLKKLHCALHAYCLMTNHVHLLATPSDGTTCAILMRELGRRYVPYFNGRYGRSGTLWEGRFRSCLVESREYVLACYRYIERNPVRAGMASSPSAYPWSSYRANSGQAEDGSLTEHPEYLALALDPPGRRDAYRRFCEGNEDPGFVSAMRSATNGGFPLVGDALRSRLATTGSRIARGKPGPRTERGADHEPMTGQLEL